MTQKQVNYQALSEELETILADLQQDDIDVEMALKKYERGLEITATLETYLKTAEQRVTKLKLQRPADASD